MKQTYMTFRVPLALFVAFTAGLGIGGPSFGFALILAMAGSLVGLVLSLWPWLEKHNS